MMALLLATLFAPVASACSVCAGGRSDEAMARGMNMGILALLIVVACVLIAFASFAVFLARRAARFAAQPPQPSADTAAEAGAELVQPDSQLTK